MKTFIKTIKTMTAVLMIVAGLLALFTIDNAEGITTLIAFAIVMLLGVIGGVYLLYSTYPELIDLSEFDDKSLNSLEDCQQKLEELREHNLLLIDRYMAFKSIINAAKIINADNMEKYPYLYKLIYEEDLVDGVKSIKESSLEQIDRFKEVYN